MMLDNDDFLWGMMFGRILSDNNSNESDDDTLSYQTIHEIIVRNFNAKKEIFQTFEKKEEISDCFMKIDQEIKKLFE
jgi:hypothetical protein